MKLIAKENGSKEIVEELGIKVRTVEKQRQNVEKKLGVSGVVGKVVYTTRNKYV